MIKVYQSKIAKYAGHTAGPWEPHVEGEYPGINHNEGSVIIFGYKDEECGIRGKDRQQRLANAALIADAPYLACEVERLRGLCGELVEVLDEFVSANEAGYRGSVSSLDIAAKKARTELAKAKGGDE